MISTLRILSLLLIPTPMLVGCGEKKADTASADSASVVDSANPDVSDTAASATAGDTAAQPASEASSGAAASDEVSKPVTVDDIARWEKGMAAEMQAVQGVPAKMKTAKNLEDTSTVMMEANEPATLAAGAQAAGLDETRYDFVRDHLSDAVIHLSPLEQEAMLANLPPAMREKMKKENDSTAKAYFEQMTWAVPPDVVEALRPRARELRKKDLELVGARLKAAGLGAAQ